MPTKKTTRLTLRPVGKRTASQAHTTTSKPRRSPTRSTAAITRSRRRSRRAKAKAPILFGLRWHHIGGLGLLFIGVAWSLFIIGSTPGTGSAASCSVSSTLVNSCRPWLGAAVGFYPQTGADLKSQTLYHEQRIGRQLDVVHDYHKSNNNQLSADDVYFATRANTKLMLNWKPVDTWSSADGSNAAVNATIDQMANSIKSLGSTKIFLTIYHEPEDNVSPGGSPSCGSSVTYKGSAGSTTDYVNMWHNVRARFDAAGVTNVVWVMNYMGFSNWNCMVKDLWPGNGYVDWVAWDPYVTINAQTFTNVVSPFYDYLSNNSDAAHDFTGKTWGLNEWGAFTGVDQAHVYSLYDAAKSALDAGTYPRLKLYSIFDTENAGDFRVDYSAGSAQDDTEQSHYIAFANDSHLADPTPPPPPPPSDTTPPTTILTAPSDHATVSGAINVTGTASDNVGVSSVTLRVDDVFVAGDSSAPYSFSLDTTKYSDGNHTLALRAFDAANNMGQSQTITVNINNRPTSNGGGGSSGSSTGGTTSGGGSSSGGGSQTTVIAAASGSSSTPTKVNGTVIVTPTKPGDSVQLQIDGKNIPTNAVDTTQLTNGVHTLSITENGKTIQRKILVHNPWVQASLNFIKAHLLVFTLTGTLLLAALGASIYFERDYLRLWFFAGLRHATARLFGHHRPAHLHR